jgi:hypothetical protein
VEISRTYVGFQPFALLNSHAESNFGQIVRVWQTRTLGDRHTEQMMHKEPYGWSQ